MILPISPSAPVLVRGAAAAILYLHIGGGLVGVATGWAAILAPKGERVHRIAGSAFFVAMLVMAGIGAAVSPFMPSGQWSNTTAAVFTLYMVVTSWATVRRGEGQIGRLEVGAAFVALGLAVMGLTLVWVGLRDGKSAGFAAVYVFAGVAAIAGGLDLDMILRGGVRGAGRIARHLWRMSAALLVATSSLFLGQQRLLPQALRGTVYPVLPVLAVLVLLFFWLYRVRFARRSKAPAAA